MDENRELELTGKLKGWFFCRVDWLKNYNLDKMIVDLCVDDFGGLFNVNLRK